MPRRPKADSVLELLGHSAKAHELAQRAGETLETLARDCREIIPTAQAARMLGVSVRLLWDWIKVGALATFRHREGSRKRSGITKKALREFLRELGNKAWTEAPTKERRRPAEERCMKVFRALAKDQDLSPREMAAKAGVSASTVYLLVREGCLSVWHPTSRRARICGCHFFQKKHLRRKKA